MAEPVEANGSCKTVNAGKYYATSSCSLYEQTLHLSSLLSIIGNLDDRKGESDVFQKAITHPTTKPLSNSSFREKVTCSRKR